MAPPTPSDSAGGSTHAAGDDGLVSSGPAAAHLSNPPNLNHFVAPVTAAGFIAQPAHSHQSLGGMHAGDVAHNTNQIDPQPAHSMQNSVFTARRWDRATGSTSTVGGSKRHEKSEDSAGDSCGGGFSNNDTADGPVDSTLAQQFDSKQRNTAGHETEDDDGEIVSGARAATSGFGIGATDTTGPAAVDSAHATNATTGYTTGGIGDGFTETGGFTGFCTSALPTGGFAVGAGPVHNRRGNSRSGGGKRRGGSSKPGTGSGFNAGKGGTGESENATDPSDQYIDKQPWEITAEEMLPAARALRQHGSSLLERGAFAEAEMACEHAVRFVEYEDAFDTDEAKLSAKVMKVDCLIDVSACALERGDTHKALRVADAALSIDSENVFALLRRASANAHGGAHDVALQDTEKAVKLAPNDARVVAEKLRINSMRNQTTNTANANHHQQPSYAPKQTNSFGPSGPAFSAPNNANPPPVPLFHSAPREINSPVPPGTAAAARALAQEEAEGECEAQHGLGIGGMDIGVGGADVEIEQEHGYAPAYSEEHSGDFGSPGVSGGGRGVMSGPGGGTAGDVNGMSDRGVSDRGANNSGGAARDNSGSLGHVPPNHPVRPAVSGATPAQNFSGRRGELSAGPANGSLDVLGGGGGQSFGNAQQFSASVGARSMQKNGDPTAAVGAMLGGDDSEEDGEEIGSRPGGGNGGDADMENDD